MNTDIRIAAVIVTFNRLSILKQSIAAIENQTLQPNAIIVINNGSTDGTTEWLNKQTNLHVVNKNNDGSAGAYYAGVKKAFDEKYDYIWLMDDDGIADENALLELTKAISIVKNFSFLCSKIISIDNVFMNAPVVDERMSKYNYQAWGQFAEFAITAVKSATYISLFLNAKHLPASGFPCRDFYFWADDIDFTKRLYKTGSAYMVGKSIVKHLRVNPNAPSILSETDERRIALHFYNIRNTIYLIRRDGKKLDIFRALYFHLQTMLRSYSTEQGSKKVGIYLKGIWAGLFFKPAIDKY